MNLGQFDSHLNVKKPSLMLIKINKKDLNNKNGLKYVNNTSKQYSNVVSICGN